MLRFALLAAASLVPAVASAAPDVRTFLSDAAFIAFESGGTYSDRGNASILWGGANNASFEYAIRAAGDAVIGAPGQIDWSDGNHALGLNAASDPFVRYQPSGQVDLAFGVTELGANPNGNPTGNYALTRTLPIAGLNAVFFRARTPATGTANANFNDITVSYDGNIVSLGDLIGDGDAEYIGLIDADLASGFTVEILGGGFNFGTGVANALPALQVKFGTAVIETPAPAAFGLFGLGLLGLAVRRR